MTTTSFIAPGFGNTYIPQAEAALQSNFSQNVNEFKVNQYCTIANVQNPSHYDIIHDPDEEIRHVYSNSSDMLWADGSDAPRRFIKRHNFNLHVAQRYALGFTIGDVAAENATWDVLADHASSAAAGLMVNRTAQALTALTTAGNYPTGNTDTAANYGGGQWSSTSNTNLYVQKTIQAGVRQLEKSTNRTVSPDNLVLVISPLVAHTIAITSEIRGMVANAPAAKEYLEQSDGWKYGLPAYMYGVRVIVENAVMNTAKENLVASTDYVLGKSALLVQRPGSLQGNMNTMSTLTFGMYKDMSILTEHDNLNLRTAGVVFDYYSTIMRGAAGIFVQSVIV